MKPIHVQSSTPTGPLQITLHKTEKSCIHRQLHYPIVTVAAPLF